MNQIQDDTIAANLNLDETSFKELKAQFSTIVEIEKRLALAVDALKQCFQVIREQREKVPKMAEVLQSVEQAIGTVQESKKQYVSLIDLKIIPSLNGQLEQIKVKKQLQQDYQAKKGVEKLREDKKNSSNDESKQKELYQQLESAKKDKMISAQTLTTQYTIYVNEKNAEFKAMLQHLLNSLMVIAASGIQEYSKVAHQILQTDERADAELFLGQMLGNAKKN